MTDLFFAILIFAASFVIGDRLIRRVPAMLHTPLMSMTNAISAVVVLGSLSLLATPRTGAERLIIAVALVAATFNIVGGFAITGRMLKMFKSDTATPRGGPA